jgi:hypothetical protein
MNGQNRAYLYHSWGNPDGGKYALAVRPGDVAAVPIPSAALTLRSFE